MYVSIAIVYFPFEVFIFLDVTLNGTHDSPHFMEPEGSLRHSQVPATCACPKPD